MIFYPWLNLALGSAASLGLFYLLSPPYEIQWLFFICLIPFQIAYLKYPVQGKWFVFPMGAIVYFMFPVLESSFGGFVPVTTLFVVIVIAVFFKNKLVEKNVDLFYPFFDVGFWIMVDLIRSFFFGHLYAPASLIDKYLFLFRTSRVFGPQFILVLSLLIQKSIALCLVNRKKRNVFLLTLLLLIFLLNGISGFMMEKDYKEVQKVTVLTLPDDFDASLERFMIQINSLLKGMKFTENSFFLLPFLPYDMDEENEDKITRLWGEIAKFHKINLIIPCKDRFFNYNSVYLFNPQGDLVEVGEQRYAFPFRKRKVETGDYSLILKRDWDYFGFLLNEEIFYDHSLKSLNRLGGRLIFHSGKIEGKSNYYYKKSLVLVAALNEIAIVSNLFGDGYQAVLADGTVKASRPEGHYFRDVLKIPLGNGFTLYQRWGNIIGWGSVLFIVIPIIIFLIEKNRED